MSDRRPSDHRNWFMYYYVRIAPIAIIGGVAFAYVRSDAPMAMLPVALLIAVGLAILQIRILSRYTGSSE